MKNDEDAPRFIPLVKESSVLVQDDPFLPDDIELSHEKHQRVLRTWEPQEARLSFGAYQLPYEDCEESSRVQRRTRISVLASLCLFCVGAVAIAVLMVSQLGLTVTGPSPGPSRGSTKDTLTPSTAPTEIPTSRVAHDVFPNSSESPTTPTLAPSMDVTTSDTFKPDTSPPTVFEVAPTTSSDSTTTAPTHSPTMIETASDMLKPDTPPSTSFPTSEPAGTSTSSPTGSPTMEQETIIPVFQFGLGSTDGPSVESSTLAPSSQGYQHDAAGSSTTSPSLDFVSSASPSQVDSIAPSLSDTTSGESGNSLEPSGSVRACNGLVTNCFQRVNELMFAALHNGMSSAEDGFHGPSHLRRLEEALEAGYRGIMLESCDCGANGIQLCNSYCFSGTREPVRVFENVVDFLTDRPNEVIVLIIESDEETLRRLFDVVFTEVQLMRPLLYSHPGIGIEWPLLRELIDLDQRLIVFQHGGLDCNTQYACPNGIHNMFSYMFETPTNLNGTQDLVNYEVSCAVQQGSVASDFFVLNHYANGVSGMADLDTAAVENSKAIIRQRLTACRKEFGRDPSLLVVEFWSIGDALEIVNIRNKRLAIDSF